MIRSSIENWIAGAAAADAAGAVSAGGCTWACCGLGKVADGDGLCCSHHTVTSPNASTSNATIRLRVKSFMMPPFVR
jgi:hypothetical protein